MQPNITILGGGIAGLSTALALSKIGIVAHLFESASEVKPVGAGLALAANAMMGFKKIGIAEEVASLGRFLEAFSIYDQQGKLISQTITAELSQSFGQDNFTIHRAQLHALLLSKLSHLPIQTNKRATHFEQILGKIRVFFQDGSHHDTDYLIAADGIHSAIRQQLLPKAYPRYAGYTCWRAVIDNNKLGLREASETWGKNGRFGIVPLANEQVYWFACINAPQNSPKMKNFKVADLCAQFAHYHATIPEILGATSDEQLIWNDIIDLEPIRQYAHGQILLIGDAAHATTPNMGQGACQAIEDAAMLLEILEKESDFAKAFKLFEQKRLARTHFIVNTSWKIGKVAQVESPFLIWLRNSFFRMIPKSINQKQLRKIYEVDFKY